ncbi:MAG: GNAT family N-acetyltransferase [Pseudomonadota bacterium]
MPQMLGSLPPAINASMADPPTSIATDRLLLRPFQQTDVEAYAAIRAKPDVVRYLPGGGDTVKGAREIAEKAVAGFSGLWSEQNGPGYGPWAVVHRSSGELIGHLGLRLLPDLGGETEILYMLDNAVWGRGLASEGARAGRDYGFDHLGLDRIIAMALPENAASLRVMEKIGMSREPGLVEAFGLKVVQYTMRAGDPRL